MTTTQKVQLDRPGGLVALIGPGYRAKCDHGTCYEAAQLGDPTHPDTCECPIDKGYLHIMIGSEADGGGIYLDGAVNATVSVDAADEFIAALNARVRHIRNIGAAKITPAPERGPRT